MEEKKITDHSSGVFIALGCRLCMVTVLIWLQQKHIHTIISLINRNLITKIRLQKHFNMNIQAE